MLTPLALAALTALAPLQEPAPGRIRGQVRAERSGEPLAYAVVEVVGTAEPLATLADSAGHYLLGAVPTGWHRLRASRVDHASLEVEVFVPAGRDVVLDLSLAMRPVALPAVTARANREPSISDTARAPPSELAAATLRTLVGAPGVAELGLGSAGVTAPGHAPVDPSDVLYVRGAPADLKLVLLDGAPVYSPFHLGGLIQPFEPGALRSAELYLGGAPARFDGGLSYVLDLKTRAGRRTGLHATGSADMLSARVQVEGPLGDDSGFLLSGRTLHGQGAEWMLNGRFPYGYADLLGRVDVSTGEEGALGFTGFWNRETVRLDEFADPGDAAEWGNGAGSFRYRGPLGEGVAELTAAFGSFRARLPLGDAQLLPTEGIARRVRLAADLSRPIGEAQLWYGVSYERMTLGYKTRPGPGAGATLYAEATESGTVTGAYADVAWQPGKRLLLRSGLRADVFSPGSIRFAPRISATWLLTDRAALKIAAGRYRQFIRSSGPTLVAETDSTGPQVYLPPPLALARASHLVVALDQELADEMRFGIEGFFKSFDGMPVVVTAEPVEPGPDATTRPARARASGVDLWLRRDRGRYTGWLGYSLAWVWAADAQRSATDLFAGRQLLTAGISGPIAGRGLFELRVAYGAGLPYAAVPGGAGEATAFGDAVTLNASAPTLDGIQGVNNAAPPLSTGPDEPYLRLDAEISRPWTGRWGNRSFTITPYVRVLNALDRRDALFYHADPGQGGEPRPLAELPVLPIIGVQWTF